MENLDELENLEASGLQQGSGQGPNTRLIHPDYVAPSDFKSNSTAIHHASTVLFKNVAEMRRLRWQEREAYTYGLHGTPTTYTLEARLAEIEGGNHCMVVPSGLAAIVMINFGLLKSGDEVLLPENVYYPSRDFADWMERDFGIKARFYAPMDTAAFAAMLTPQVKLVWTEAPGSVTMEVPDIPALCAAAHAHGIPVALDNTWSAGIAFDAFSHGVDIVMQALTKYQSGGSDVLMGAVITRDASLFRKVQMAHARLGFNVGMDDAWLVLRGLDTMRLRFAAHDTNARAVAAFLAQRDEVVCMLHPAYEDCPGHAHWLRDFTGAGGLFSVVLNARYTEAQVDRFVDSLTLFGIGYSWGGTHSLCLPYRMQGLRAAWPHEGILVRFYIGLEDPVDLIADIERAFANLT